MGRLKISKKKLLKNLNVKKLGIAAFMCLSVSGAYLFLSSAQAQKSKLQGPASAYISMATGINFPPDAAVANRNIVELPTPEKFIETLKQHKRISELYNFASAVAEILEAKPVKEKTWVGSINDYTDGMGAGKWLSGAETVKTPRFNFAVKFVPREIAYPKSQVFKAPSGEVCISQPEMERFLEAFVAFYAEREGGHFAGMPPNTDMFTGVSNSEEWWEFFNAAREYLEQPLQEVKQAQQDYEDQPWYQDTRETLWMFHDIEEALRADSAAFRLQYIDRSPFSQSIIFMDTPEEKMFHVVKRRGGLEPVVVDRMMTESYHPYYYRMFCLQDMWGDELPEDLRNNTPRQLWEKMRAMPPEELQQFVSRIQSELAAFLYERMRSPDKLLNQAHTHPALRAFDSAKTHE